MARSFITDPNPSELKAMLPGLIAYAARWLRATGVPGDPGEFVNGAIERLYRGRCPSDVPIRAFLKRTIMRLVTNAARQAWPRWEPIPDDAREPDEVENEAALREVRDRVLLALEQKADAANDIEVFELVNAYVQGHDKRADLAEAAGLTLPQFDAARKRLTTMLSTLPPEWRGLVKEAGVNS